jgi:peptidoglycan/LPS O-acetylase OafA/YrhL
VVELRFYALISIILFGLGNVSRIVEVALVWLALTALTWGLLALHIPGAGRLQALLLTKYSAFFVIGICLFRMHVSSGDRLVWTTLLLALATGALQAHVDFARVDMLDGVRSPWWVGLGISLGTFLLAFAAIRIFVPERWAPLATRLGAMSFPLYLVHQRLGYWFIHHCRPLEEMSFVGSAHGAAIVASLVVAYAVSRFAEPPLQSCLRVLSARLQGWQSNRNLRASAVDCRGSSRERP